MQNGRKKRLVIVPNDPIELYEQAGFGWFLENYFNPRKLFEEVFALSPMETHARHAFGLTILPAPVKDFQSMVKDLQPDVIRAYAGHWPAELVCRHRVPSVPVVVSVHDTHPDMVKKVVRYADLIWCVSAAVEKEVLARGANRQQIRRLPNRVDAGVFHRRTDPAALAPLAQRFPPGKYILHVGRKVPQKNLDTLIRALAHLPTEYACIFAGLGDCAPYVSLANQVGVASRCHWIAAIANSDLPLWYSWCDCMCTPSRWEGFGIVFIEAAACGAAIVTSDIAPMNEFLTNEVSACLVQHYEEPPVLARAIQRACEDQPYRTTIRAGALEASKPFERHVIDTLEATLYEEAMRVGPYRFSLKDRIRLAIWRARGGGSSLTQPSAE